jgi:predicted transposase/invertase (TIGR01784 family)
LPLRQRAAGERALYLACSAFASNYGRKGHMRQEMGVHGAKFSSLVPVYGINVLDFALFRQDGDPLRSYVLYDRDHARTLGDGPLLTVSFFELSKKVPKDAGNIAHWKRFFKEGRAEGDAPAYIRKALEVVEFRNLSSEERTMISARELAEEDRKGQIAYAYKEGREQGLVATATAALEKGLRPELVHEITGLDLDIIKRLAMTAR